MSLLAQSVDSYKESTPPEYDRLEAPDAEHFACCTDEHGVKHSIDAIGGEWKCIRGHRPLLGWRP